MKKQQEFSSWEPTLERFLNREEIKRLRKWVIRQKNKKNDRIAQNDWIIIELLLNTGLRVQELADLKCGDIILRNELSCVKVEHGKGDKPREVLISRAFQGEVEEYIKIKEVNKRKNRTRRRFIVFPSFERQIFDERIAASV